MAKSTPKTDAERFMVYRTARLAGRTQVDRTVALADLIRLGLTTLDPGVKKLVTDFLVDQEKILADLSPPVEMKLVAANSL